MLITPKFSDIPFLHANRIEVLQFTYCILLVLQFNLQNNFSSLPTQEIEVLDFALNSVEMKIKLNGCKSSKIISKI